MGDGSNKEDIGSLKVRLGAKSHDLDTVMKDHAGNAWVAHLSRHQPQYGRHHVNATVLNPDGEAVCHTDKAPSALIPAIVGINVLATVPLDIDNSMKMTDRERTFAIKYAKDFASGRAVPIEVHPGDIPNLCKPNGHKR